MVGIIGRNGAGKSTLLKILSRITEPTEGAADIYGRVGSLLEVGTGFHPELTGRENIYLNGAILGMRRAEIDRKLDEIVAFAEIEKFLDTPVKHYSSGMYVRLAFAVAAHLEPEILLVDEVLAVGDAAFQKKCLGKMGDVANEGRTVLLVSHNMGAIGRLCPSTILLQDGEITAYGHSGEVISEYLRKAKVNDLKLIRNLITFRDPTLKVHSIQVNGADQSLVTLASDEHNLEVVIEGELSESKTIELEVRFYDTQELPLGFYSPGHQSGAPPRLASGPFTLRRTIELPKIARGEYLLSLFLTDPNKSFWMKAPFACRLVAQGSTTATGLVLDYSRGNGWVLLP